MADVTKPLDLKLSNEEIPKPFSDMCSCEDCADGRRTIADAATAKAAWGIVEFWRTDYYLFDLPEALEAAGIERSEGE